MWFLAAFGLLTVFWDVGARRLAGARTPWWGALRKDALPAFVVDRIRTVGVAVKGPTTNPIGGGHV